MTDSAARTAPSPAPWVVLVGQLPPPVHGQALAIERLVRARFEKIRLHHVPMEFSDTIVDVGRFQFRKLPRMLRLIWGIWKARLSTRAKVMCYATGGPSYVSFLRDFIVLALVRPIFQVVIFDVHAGGLAEFGSGLPWWSRWAFRRTYYGADLIIERYPEAEGTPQLPANRRMFVPNGVEDDFRDFASPARRDGPFNILFVGLLTASKGIFTLLEAVSLLKQRGIKCSATLVGEFDSLMTESHWKQAVRDADLESEIELTGRLMGDHKWSRFLAADVFCFPSCYPNEAYPLVIIEAMQFELPVVASRWRGIPYIVEDGISGLLIPPDDPEATADQLERLAKDPGLRRAMGRAGRQHYLESHTESRFLDGMEAALSSACPSPLYREAEPSE